MILQCYPPANDLVNWREWRSLVRTLHLSLGDIHGGHRAVISELSDTVFTGNSLETRFRKNRVTHQFEVVVVVQHENLGESAKCNADSTLSKVSKKKKTPRESACDMKRGPGLELIR